MVAARRIRRVEALSDTQGRPVEWILPPSVIKLIKEATELCNTAARELVVYYHTQMPHEAMSDENDDVSHSPYGDGEMDTDDGDLDHILRNVTTAKESQLELYDLAGDCINGLRSRINQLKQPMHLSSTMSFTDISDGFLQKNQSSSSSSVAATIIPGAANPGGGHSSPLPGTVPPSHMAGYSMFESHLKTLLTRRRTGNKMGKMKINTTRQYFQ